MSGVSEKRSEAFTLLDKLCMDSLECHLSSVLQDPGGDIGATFVRLFDLIEELTADV